MWKFLLLAIAAYICYKLFANDFLKKKEKEAEVEREEREEKVKCGEMVKDPVCGTYVSVEDSISVRDGDKTWHFCSHDCRDKFLDQLEAGGRVLLSRPRREDEE